MNSRNVSSKWQCTRCSKNYQYKGGLSAHIKKKHPISDDSNMKSKTSKNSVPKASKPDRPISTSPLIVQPLISISTQELESLLEEEEEFYETVEEFEHNVGVNASMVDWYNVNFESSFVNTGEFAKRTTVVIQ